MIRTDFEHESYGQAILPCPRGLLLAPPTSLPEEPVSVEGLKPAQGETAEDRQESLQRFARLWTNATVSRLSLAGFYRLLPAGQDNIEEPEWEFLRPLSPPGSLLLTCGPAGEGCLVFRVFLIATGQLLGELNSMPETAAESTWPRMAPPPLPEELSDLPEEPPGAGGRWNRKTVAAGILLTLGLAASTGVVRYLGKKPQPAAATPPSAIDAKAVPDRPPDDRPLGLQVSADRKDGYWELTWRRNSRAVENALFGNLQISDGQKPRDVFLDTTELRNGYILYAPDSDMVTLRLEVMTPDRGLVTESTRVMRPVTAKRAAEPPATEKPATPVSRTPRPARVPEWRRLVNVANHSASPVHRPALEAAKPVITPQEQKPAGGETAATSAMRRAEPATSSAPLPGYPGSAGRQSEWERQPEEWRTDTREAATDDESTRKPPLHKRVFEFLRRGWRPKGS